MLRERWALRLKRVVPKRRAITMSQNMDVVLEQLLVKIWIKITKSIENLLLE